MLLKSNVCKQLGLVVMIKKFRSQVKHDLLHKVESENSYVGCSNPESKHNCYFLICTKCNKIQESFDEKVLQAIYDNCAMDNFQTSKIILEIKGLCLECV
jgi:Fur family zinc uptake transcriptional regulator